MQTSRNSKGWRLGTLAALAVTCLSLYPQINLWALRASAWHGTYAHVDSDEVAYSAYLQALIDGRPRRNDPYTGRDHSAFAPQAESLFSIQFIPAYACALMARALGLNANSFFILLMPLAAFSSALALFWLLRMLAGDERLAATAVVTVLCLGTFSPVYVSWRMLRGQDITYAWSFLPFLRRFQPAVSFPLFFIFCALVWRALVTRRSMSAMLLIAAAASVFALLVFSYFYLWTAALAWLICLLLVLLSVRPEGWRRDAKRLVLICAGGALCFIPYWLLLSQRPASMDAVQLLSFSRRPDLFHWSEILGIFVTAAVLFGIRRGRVEPQNYVALFAVSLSLVPLVVFNQQVLTGRSLQPLHYDLFIAKYTALVSLFLLVRLFWKDEGGKSVPARLLWPVALAAFGWGCVETVVATHRYAPESVRMDAMRPVALRVGELARQSKGKEGEPSTFTLSTDPVLADCLPTDARVGLLWSPHMQVFSGITPEENGERIYRQLYYTGVHFEQSDAEHLDRLPFKKSYFIHSLIGWGRADPAWNANSRPATTSEIHAILDNYERFSASFNRERAATPALSFVLAPAGEAFDWKNLDRWYERDEGERVGDFLIYRVRLRP